MKQDKRAVRILCLLGIVPVVWLGLLIAPAASGGLPEIFARFTEAVNDPTHIELCEDSFKTVLLFLFAYGMCLGIYFSTRHNYRRGEEHGSAKWGDAKAIDKKYRAKKPEANKLFTQSVGMGLDGRKHRRNLNTMVVGGSGAGKTRFSPSPISARPTPALLSSTRRASWSGIPVICWSRRAMKCGCWIC